MNRAAAWNVTGVLCALWLGACAGTSPAATKLTTPADDKASATALDSNADVAAIAKNLPTTLDGEIRRAQLLRSKGDLDDSGHALAQLMLVAPDDARVVGEYGKVLAQQGHSRDAISFLQRAVELQPKDWSLYSALGVAYDQNDDHSHARLAYEHALALAPSEPAVLNNMAVSHMLASDWSGAQRLLTEASGHGASNPKIANNLEMLASLKKPVVIQPQPTSTAVATEPKPAAHVGVKTASREAIAPPKSLNPIVVMQAIPADPQAGPVKSKPTGPVRVATAAKKPKHVAQVSPPPALRTAAEAN
jgi:Flp pilus assembly protein TadD